MTRLIADIVLFAVSLFLPWWLAILFGAAMFFAFGDYYEFLVAAFLLDILHSAPGPRFGGFQFLLSAFAALAALIFSIGKRRMRLSRRA